MHKTRKYCSAVLPVAALLLAAAGLSAQQAPVIHAITTLDQPFDVEIPGVEIPPAIAKDSVFLIWGENLGPEEGISATDALNPPLDLCGTTVRITADDGSAHNAALFWASNTQLNVLLPATTPTGQVQLHVTYGGSESNTARLKAVTQRPRLLDFVAPIDNPFFGRQAPIAQRVTADGVWELLTPLNPAHPGDTIVLWTTGMQEPDRAAAADFVQPPMIRLGQFEFAATYAGPSGCCDGVDQVQFVLPAEAPTSCAESLSVRGVTGLWSDREIFATAPEGETCPPTAEPAARGAVGRINLTRQISAERNVDAFSATFFRDFPIPPALRYRASGCSTTYAVGSFISGDFSFDLGSPLTFETQTRTFTLEPGPLGAQFFHEGEEANFLGAGTYTVSAPGGADVEAFSAQIEGFAADSVGLLSSTPRLTADALPRLTWPAGTAPEVITLRANLNNDLPDDEPGIFERTLLTISPGVSVTCYPDIGSDSLEIPQWLVEAARWGRWQGTAGQYSFENAVVATGFWTHRAQFTTEGLDYADISYTHAEDLVIPYDGPYFAQTPVYLPNGDSILAELATTAAERSRGLMNRQSLATDRGMLFQFAAPASHSFWMFQTLIPLDIIWLSADKEILFINANTPPCEAAPCPTYGGQVASTWVLELAAGEAEKRGLQVGAELNW